MLLLLKARGNPQNLKIRERRLEDAHNESKKVKKVLLSWTKTWTNFIYLWILSQCFSIRPTQAQTYSNIAQEIQKKSETIKQIFTLTQ